MKFLWPKRQKTIKLKLQSSEVNRHTPNMASLRKIKQRIISKEYFPIAKKWISM